MSRLFAARAAVAAGLMVGTAAGVVVYAPAASAVPGPAPTLSKTTIALGEPFTVSGDGCVDAVNPSDMTPVSVHGGAFVGQTRASETGFWSLTMDVGAQLGPGTYTVSAVCYPGHSENIFYANATVTVVGPPLPPPPSRIPPPPTGPSVARPSAAPTAARTTAPATPTATSSSAAPIPTPAAPALPLTPSPAPGCADCTRITAGEALAPGQRLSLRYTGFQPGEQVTLVMRSAPVTLGAFTADATGTVTADVTLPATAEAGAHTLHLSGPVTGEQVVGIRVAAAPRDRETVVAAPASRGTALLLPLGLGGAGTVLLAAGGFVLHRRRVARSAQATDTPIAAPIA